MNKKTFLPVAVIISGVIIIAGGIFAFNQSDNDSSNNQTTENSAMEKKEGADAMENAMEKAEGEAMEKKDGEAMEKTDDAISKSGSFITLADYNADPSKYSDSKKVYFFHASWCPICKGIESEINADPSKIPAGVTLIKTDFDDETDLRQKYGITTQYTFVEFNENGDELNKFSATSLDKVIEQI